MTEVATRGSKAVASLQNLKSGLANVQAHIPSTGGALLRFGRDGIWVYGADNIEVEEGSKWAFNPFSLMHGWVSWTDHDEKSKKKNEIVGEVMVPMTEARPPVTAMKDTGWDWTEQLAVQVACVSGEDTGVQTTYKCTSVGGMNAMRKLIGEIMKQLDVDPGKPVPVATLNSDSYPHKTWGKTYVPILHIVDWATMDQIELDDRPEPEQPDDRPEPQAAEPVRRRGQAASEPAQQASQAAPQPEPAQTRRRGSGAVPETGQRQPEQAQAPEQPNAPLRRRRV